MAGETFTVTVNLPDGTSAEIELQASESPTAAPGTFTIGVDENDTAANFEAALRAETARVAQINLRAASAVQAADEFFDFSAGSPPQRVDGPPFETATALIDATTADTVYWYQGDLTTPARESALARIDEGYTVAYGTRADEDALANVVKQVALVAASRFDASVDDDSLRFAELRERGLPAIAAGPAAGTATVEAIATEIAHQHVAIQTAADRHAESLAYAKGVLEKAEGVDLEEIGVKFLRLQTQLQASYETTAILSRLSLANFI